MQKEGGIVHVAIRPYQDTDFDVVTSIWMDVAISMGKKFPDVEVALRKLREWFSKAHDRGWVINLAVADSEVVGVLIFDDNKVQEVMVVPPLAR